CLFISVIFFFFFSSRRRHTRSKRDWSSDVCSSDLGFYSFFTVFRLVNGFKIIENGCTIFYTYFTGNVSSDMYTTHLMLRLWIDTVNAIRHPWQSIGNEKEDVFYSSFM